MNYDQYKDIGGTLEEAEFERVIVAACATVDKYTFGRLRINSLISENVQYCIRDLCEYLSINNPATAKAITSKSQSAGGVSESESYATKSASDINSQAYGIVEMYLATEFSDGGVPLMYKGAQDVVGKIVDKRAKLEFDVKYGKNTIDVPMVTYRD